MTITFLHPGFLYAADAAAAAVVALHFLVAEQPRAGALPTVRFFPDVQVRSTALAVRLSDLLLLFVRVLVLLLIGAAFAQPQVKPSRSAVLRLLVVDASRAVNASSEVRDSAAKYLRGATRVIAFDSVATEMSPSVASRYLDSFKSDPRSAQHPSLSTALIAALRAASRMREKADSLDLILISPMLAEEMDTATLAIREMWPGRINVVRVAGARDTLPVRRTPKIEWADSSRGISSWMPRARPDTVGALRFEGGVVVYPFIRKWKRTRADSSARIVGRWVDGEPAILERRTSSGCLRSVSAPIPVAGDAILRPSFVRFLESLQMPCANAQSFGSASGKIIGAIEGPAHLAPTSLIRPEAARVTPIVPWLLGAALLLSLLELLLRRIGERRRA